MKTKIIAMSVLSILASATQAVTIVDGGTVNFKGQFINAACVVSTETANQTVQLGQYRTASITAVGQTTTNVPFNIDLINCDSTVSSSAQIAFTGTTDTTDNTLLSVNASGGNQQTATGVGIEILDRTGATLTPDGTSLSAAQTLLDGPNVNSFLFNARYKSTAASVSAGQADGSATFQIHYQ